MKQKLFASLVVLLPLTISSCGASTTEVTPKDDFGVTGVHLDEKEIFIARGESHALTAEVSVVDESIDKSLTWVSSDNNIASVSKNGVVTGGSTSGTCYVSAISVVGGYSDKCTVYVSGGGTVTVTKLTLSQTEITFDGTDAEAVEVIPTIEPINIPKSVITWSNSDDKVATYIESENGVIISPLAIGSTTLTAKAGGKTANCIITVKEKEVDPTLPSITFTASEKTLNIGEEFTISAATKNIPDGEALNFELSNDNVATIKSKTNREITLSAKEAGTVNVTASYGAASALCVVKVNPSQDDYQKFLDSFSQKGHIYLHYLRTTDQNYDPWAVWMWQKVPEDSEGTLWGATKSEEIYQKAGITSITTKWMSKDDVKLGGSETYSDSNGQIVDIDVSRTDLKGGKTGVATSFQDDQGNYCNRAGFLIVDQTKMTGGSHWKSDGGIEAYIRDFSTKVNGDKYLHIYCIEGQVTRFTEESGQPIEVNPTITDTTGQYRSKNDIENLLRDDHEGSYSPTSSSFLDDKPGVGYQIFVPAFADSNGDGLGDLGGIITKLKNGYFNDLGVGVLWLTPVQESGSYHGYDVTDYYKIDPKFGTMDQYKELISLAHKNGIKVLMDMVINHTSKNNVLFTESQKAGKVTIDGQEYNARDMYLWKFKGDMIREWDGVEVASGQTATYNNIAVENSGDWYQDGSSSYYYYGKFGSSMAELNYSCEATRKYMSSMCKWWLKETGLDGFRLDAVKHIYLASELSPEDAIKYKNDTISTDVSYRTYYDDEKQQTVTAKNDYTYDRDLNVKFWKEFAYSIKSEYPSCFLVGENFDGWNERIAPFYESLDSQFDFSTYYHLNEMGPESIGTDVKTTLEINKNVRNNHINGAFTSNHDIARMMNHAAGALKGNKTHHAEINDTNYQATINQARYASALTLLTPGVSWIYYGDELGMTGNLEDKIAGEEDHGNNTDRWYRQSMKWADALGEQDNDGVYVPDYGFGGLKVKWDNPNTSLENVTKQKANANSMLSYFQKLGKTKQDSRYPTYGYVNWAGTIGGASNTLAMQISDGNNVVNVFINNSPQTISIPANDRMTYIIGGTGTSNDSVPAYGFMVLTNKAK